TAAARAGAAPAASGGAAAGTAPRAAHASAAAARHHLHSADSAGGPARPPASLRRRACPPCCSGFSRLEPSAAPRGVSIPIARPAPRHEIRSSRSSESPPITSRLMLNLRRIARPLSSAVILASVAAPTAIAQQLSPQEQRIVAYVDAHVEDAVSLLARLVDVNSGTMNAAGVRRVGAMVGAELDSIGFATRWVTLPDSLRRGGHLFAERRGTRGKRVLLIGHLDTVFEEDSPFQRFARNGNILSG